jgi:SRSO17 transposase
LSACQVRFRRPAGREALARDTTGRRTALPTTNGETSAQAVPGTSAQRGPEFLTTRPGEAADRHRPRGPKMIAAATGGAGVLIVDDRGFPTPGQASGGMARQDAGPLGKGGHGHVAVTCWDRAPQATWPVAVRG